MCGYSDSTRTLAHSVTWARYTVQTSSQTLNFPVSQQQWCGHHHWSSMIQTWCHRCFAVAPTTIINKLWELTWQYREVWPLPGVMEPAQLQCCTQVCEIFHTDGWTVLLYRIWLQYILCHCDYLNSVSLYCVQLGCFHKGLDLLHSNFTRTRSSPIIHSWHQKTRDTGLRDGEDRIPSAFLLFDTKPECDGQTDMMDML